MYLHRVSFLGLSLLSFTLLRPQQQRRRNKHFCAHFFFLLPVVVFVIHTIETWWRKKLEFFGLEQAQSNYCPIIAMPRDWRFVYLVRRNHFSSLNLCWCCGVWNLWCVSRSTLNSTHLSLTVITHKTVREFIFIVSFCCDDFPWMSPQINWFLHISIRTVLRFHQLLSAISCCTFLLHRI